MVLVFYTNKFIPTKFAAITRGPVIWIRPEYKEDIGLLHHELTHRKQWVTTLGFHSFAYLICRHYRLKSEVEAYKKQIEFGMSKELAAEFLSSKYNLKITKEDALKLL